MFGDPQGDEPEFTDSELVALEKHFEETDTVDTDGGFDELQRAHPAGFADFLRGHAEIERLAGPLRRAFQASPGAISEDEIPNLPEFEDLVELGRGGMGVVYLGRNVKTERLEAVKVIRPDRLTANNASDVSTMLERFRLETKLAAHVAHEFIVPVYQVGDHNGLPWYSMQYVPGSNLKELIEQGRVSIEQLVDDLERIARAIDAVHQKGIVHGDIKPQNILIDVDSNRPMLSDFGFANLINDTEIVGADATGGTTAYMAPELQSVDRQSRRDAFVCKTVASDIYALGATLWAGLVGKPPLKGMEKDLALSMATADTASRTPADTRRIPSALVEICQRALSDTPSSRFSSAAAFADELVKWLARPQWNRHFPRLGYLLCFVVAPFAAISGVITWRGIERGWSPIYVWSSMFAGYVPLFVSLFTSQVKGVSAHPARRELWSTWIGHAIASFTGLVACHVGLKESFASEIRFFYPVWASISAVTFFAKSGNFWSGYRWIGLMWAAISLLLASFPTSSPWLFGCLVAMTCLMISAGDRSFWPKPFPVRSTGRGGSESPGLAHHRPAGQPLACSWTSNRRP